MTKILLLAANPSNHTRLRLDDEVREIDRRVQSSKLRDEFELVSHWAVRIRDLQGLLLRHRPQIVHFSGHGSEDNEIILVDEQGQGHPVPAKALSQLFAVLGANIACVVLNACFSEPQANAIAEHVDYVIGMSDKMSDEASIGFAFAFYQALAYGLDIPTAFELGCIQVGMESPYEQTTPVLVRKTPASAQQTRDLPPQDDFYYRTQQVRSEDQALPAAEAGFQHDHWDRFDAYVDSLTGDAKYFVQRINSLDYLAGYGLTVKQLKEQLQVLGFYRGALDNEFTPAVTTAIAAFQKRYHLRHVDGIFGPLTYLAMEEASKRRQTG